MEKQKEEKSSGWIKYARIAALGIASALAFCSYRNMHEDVRALKEEYQELIKAYTTRQNTIVDPETLPEIIKRELVIPGEVVTPGLEEKVIHIPREQYLFYRNKPRTALSQVDAAAYLVDDRVIKTVAEIILSTDTKDSFGRRKTEYEKVLGFLKLSFF